MNRTEFWYRQRVTSPELNDDTFDEIELADWAIVKETLGFGVFNSPAVTQQTTPDLTVLVPQILGYDQLGRRTELPASQAPYTLNCAVDENGASTAVTGGPGFERWLTVFIEFNRLDTEPKTDGNGTPLFWKHGEWFKLNVVQAAEQPVGTDLLPVPRSDQIILCDIHIVDAQTQILNSDIDFDRREDFTYISLTPSYLGDLLGFIGRTFEPATITAPSADSIVGGVIDTRMSGKTPGGSDVLRGVITAAPSNYVKLTDDKGDNFLDDSGDKIYGRITESGGTWTLSFFVWDESGGVDTPFNMTPFSGQTIRWFMQETFSLDSFPAADPAFAIQSDQVAGEIPNATTTLAGKVMLVDDGADVTASKAVSAADPRLTGLGALALIRKLANRPSLIFMHTDDQTYRKFRLHQCHGLAFEDYQAGPGPANYYFEYDADHADYPLDVDFNLNTPAGIAAGPITPPKVWGGDSTFGSIVSTGTGSDWYYIYLIGRDPTVYPAPQYALVASANPPTTGPLLTDSSGSGGYDFPGNGWGPWRFIAAVVNMGLTINTWEFAQMRKMGAHVNYELGHYVFQTAASGGGWVDQSIATRVPVTSMRAFIRVRVEINNGQGAMQVRPPGLVGAPPNVAMGLREPPGIGPGTIPGSADMQFQALADDLANLGVIGNETTGWVDLDKNQNIGYRATSVGGPTYTGQIVVLGYTEYDDKNVSAFTWG